MGRLFLSASVPRTRPTHPAPLGVDLSGRVRHPGRPIGSSVWLQMSGVCRRLIRTLFPCVMPCVTLVGLVGHYQVQTSWQSAAGDSCFLHTPTASSTAPLFSRATQVCPLFYPFFIIWVEGFCSLLVNPLWY